MEKTAYRRAARILMGAALLSTSMLPSGCAPKPVEQYAARGMVVSVERGMEGHSQVTILHEAVRDFKDQTGKIVGMEPMAMTFAADGAVPTDNLQPQSKIQFVFEVHWEAAERLVLKEILPLDSETVLELNGYSVELS